MLISLEFKIVSVNIGWREGRLVFEFLAILLVAVTDLFPGHVSKIVALNERDVIREGVINAPTRMLLKHLFYVAMHLCKMNRISNI